MITAKTVTIRDCAEGSTLRWYFNGWHYMDFDNKKNMSLNHSSNDALYSSALSLSPQKISTDKRIYYTFPINIVNLDDSGVEAMKGLMLSDDVSLYYNSVWNDAKIVKGSYSVRGKDCDGTDITFTVRCEELSGMPTRLRKHELYIDGVLCDIDEDEIVAINKQCNTINDLQDRRLDYSQSFKIRKTPPMMLLFGMAGEKNTVSSFPYSEHSCRYVVNGIEMFIDPVIKLISVDDNYYNVNMYAGTAGLFATIDELKLSDLTLVDAVHDWSLTDMATSHASDLDYCYPLVEPSDDGGLVVPDMTDSNIDIFAGNLWPFIKVSAIWEEIFNNAGFTYDGVLFNNTTFDKLFLSIASTDFAKTLDITPYLYIGVQMGNTYVDYDKPLNRIAFDKDTVGILLGDDLFRYNCEYSAPVKADYTFRLEFYTKPVSHYPTLPSSVKFYKNGVEDGNSSGELTNFYSDGWYWNQKSFEYTIEDLDRNDKVTFYCDECHVNFLIVRCINVAKSAIGYGDTDLNLAVNLPDMSQKEFIKGICNMYGLIPQSLSGNHIHFWTYDDAINNISIAEDWSAYLSVKDTNTNFRLDGYARKNRFSYKESDDVAKGVTDGYIRVNDQTLDKEKDILELPFSSVDEVYLYDAIPTARIAINKLNEDQLTYTMNDKIDGRIVIVDTAGTDEHPNLISDGYINGTAYTSSLSPLRTVKLEAGKTYTFSWLAYSTGTWACSIRYYSGVTIIENHDAWRYSADGAYSIKSLTFTATNSGTFKLDLVRITNPSTLYITWVMLQEGSVLIDQTTQWKDVYTAKTLNIYDDKALSSTHTEITDPKIARGIPLYFGSLLAENYKGLSQILTNTVTRTLKFNLPALKVANLKHYIPIYLEQYNEHYIVNKISNYVEGKICEVELIKI